MVVAPAPMLANRIREVNAMSESSSRRRSAPVSHPTKRERLSSEIQPDIPIAASDDERWALFGRKPAPDLICSVVGCQTPKPVESVLWAMDDPKAHSHFCEPHTSDLAERLPKMKSNVRAMLDAYVFAGPEAVQPTPFATWKAHGVLEADDDANLVLYLRIPAREQTDLRAQLLGALNLIELACVSSDAYESNAVLSQLGELDGILARGQAVAHDSGCAPASEEEEWAQYVYEVSREAGRRVLEGDDPDNDRWVVVLWEERRSQWARALRSSMDRKRVAASIGPHSKRCGQCAEQDAFYVLVERNEEGYRPMGSYCFEHAIEQVDQYDIRWAREVATIRPPGA